ncbi:MAG: helix-turn-helix transcriptional regulator [Firmicutes bacterium]|nr:helix-turn-helix transcriptional regulator [Bacillota bacterium]
MRKLRKDNKISQEEIGIICDVGKTTVSAWENNINQPPIETITKLAYYFGVTTDYLLGFNQEDKDNIERLNIALREADMLNSDETLKEEEIKFAIEQARMYKQMLTKVLDIPTKYPEHHIIDDKKNTTKDTNN